MWHVLSKLHFAKVTLNLHFLTGKVCERRKPKRITSKREILSTYPARKNIWEYLYESNNVNSNYSEIKVKATEKKNGSRKITVILFVLFCIGAFTGKPVKITSKNRNSFKFYCLCTQFHQCQVFFEQHRELCHGT